MLLLSITNTTWIIIAAAALVVGLAVGYLITSTLLKKAVTKEETALLEEAKEKAEVIKKERILQAKEKFLQMKDEHEKACNERKRELQKTENRISQLQQQASQKMEEAVAMDSDAGFELCDLNSDEKPELIISQGTYDGAACTIYYINGENLEQLGGAYGTDGRLGFDIGSNVFYTYGAGENTYYSVADSNFSAADYTPSDSSMECGRKYLLTADNISIALQ